MDDELISFNPAVEISALKEEEQKQLLEAMDYAQAVLSLSQAQRIKKLSKENQLTLEKISIIGGADGPTSVFVAAKLNNVPFILLIVIGTLLVKRHRITVETIHVEFIS